MKRDPLSDGLNPAGEELRGRQVALAVAGAFVPGELHRRQPFAGRELVGDRRPRRVRLGVDLAALGRDPHGQAQLERHERQVGRVAGHVAQRAGAEIPPPAPVMRMINRVVGPLGRRAHEQVPVHVAWDGGRLPRPGDDIGRLLPVLERAVGPDMNLGHVSDRARANDFRPAAKARLGRALVAHLGADAFLTRRFPHQSRFPHRVRQRLLAVDVLAQPHGRHRRRRMVMVGRRDDHGVDGRPELIQQLSIIEEPLGFLELRGLRIEPLLIDVAHAHDPPVMTGLLAVAAALTPDPDASDVQHLVRPHPTGPAMPALGENAKPRDRGPVQKRSTIDGLAHGGILLACCLKDERDRVDRKPSCVGPRTEDDPTIMRESVARFHAPGRSSRMIRWYLAVWGCREPKSSGGEP